MLHFLVGHSDLEILWEAGVDKLVKLVFPEAYGAMEACWHLPELACGVFVKHIYDP